MRVFARYSICVFASFLVGGFSFAPETRGDGASREAIAPKQVEEIKKICHDLVGSQFPYDQLPWQRPWRRLLRYLPSEESLYSEPLACSGQCSGSVRLRNGLWLNFTFPNPQKFYEKWNATDGLIDSVELADGDCVIFRYEKTVPAR